MSKAPKNTAKKVAKSSTALVDLRAIVADMPALRAEAKANLDMHCKAEAKLFAVLPPRPQMAEMPADLCGVFDQITVAQFRDMPADHPYVIWQRENGAAYDAKVREYNATRARLSLSLGVNAAEARATRAEKALRRAEATAMKSAATGLEAIALKVRAIRLANYDLETDQFDGLLATIDATARAAGFKTTV